MTKSGMVGSGVKEIKKLPISLAVITLNEEFNIERCLRSAPFVDDIVVVDSHSSDKTVEIAEKLGARVFVEDWRGYRDQKARATELCKNDWVLSLDADEALSEDLAAEIVGVMKDKSANVIDAYEFSRLSFHLGRWIRHGGWYPDRQIRLFNKSLCGWGEGHVHERIRSENSKRLSSPMYHWPFTSLEDQIQTNNEYSTLAARDLYDRKKSYSNLKLVFKPISKFVETYFFKLGFLDGWAGFTISVGAAYAMFLKWAKLREIYRVGEVDAK